MVKKRSSFKKKATPNLAVSRPESVLKRTVQLDKGGLFKALGKSIAHASAGKLDELSADAGEAIAALGLKPDPGALAWILIQRALLRAMRELVEESMIHLPEEVPPKVEDIAGQLDREVEKTELEIGKDFFRQPGTLPFLKPCGEWFCQLLVASGCEDAVGRSLTARLPKYFVYALNQEWRVNHEKYAVILQASETPFTKAGVREQAWEGYLAWLERELDSPMFGEPFGLRQLYVPLRAYYHLRSENKKAPLSEMHLAPREHQRRVAVMLEEHLLHWLDHSDKSDSVRVLSGGPGSGKSSLTRMLAAAVNRDTSWRALHLPLHQVNYRGELAPVIAEYLQKTRLLADHPAHPLDCVEGDDRILLVFDGLDELAMLGKIAQNQASQFVQAVKELVRDQNTTSVRVKALISGRTVVMDGLEDQFRREGSVLHLLPYVVGNSDKELYEHGWSLLEKIDQRVLWWRKYAELKGGEHKDVPLNHGELTEITSEPLLNYLLALAYGAGGLDFSRQVTQNQIYESLVGEVYRRRWGNGENFHVRGMPPEHFQRVLEEVAVAAWHGDGRKTTVGEIKQHCKDAGIEKMLEVFQEGAEAGVLRLLTAFFFRQAGIRADENAFEFTHKSFGEYLVARRIVRLLQLMEEKLCEQDQKFSGWNEVECLAEWSKLTGPSTVTENQRKFLINEVRLRDKASCWRTALVRIANTSLKHSMPMEKRTTLSFGQMIEQSRNAEECLLVAINSCVRLSEEKVSLDWPHPTAARSWIRRLQGQHLTSGSALGLKCLEQLVFTDQFLEQVDLGDGSLAKSCFIGCSLKGANLGGANLEHAQLEEAILVGADLESANLVGTNLRKATLTKANLEGVNADGADLFAANLEKANLAVVNFSNANLFEASLVEAKLHEACFWRANMENAQLQKANLQGADLQYAELTGANLEGANLEGAYLGDSNLEKVNLERTNLVRANLERARLDGATLVGANMERVNLQSASLAGANLVGANLVGANLVGASLEEANLERANLIAF
ncbi:pentapeptide repeat-containing protein [Roseimicrobium sp. ORNL1]|uniref:pentapeptide repeat-containing protein n=1 Tax=Roseimicrobium sp. ORNL1 TaxID=2711231 RepID=UPI0013E1F8C9|nr:pentapeptide repeat-containing protein [Roseimicrobium sp. ORNL1]QIF03935.1 pentapeptide repeat-containing protein [Roseimicrobium sp. ORNL1]